MKRQVCCDFYNNLYNLDTFYTLRDPYIHHGVWGMG